MNDQLNETLLGWVNTLNGPLWDFLVIFLVAVGVFYTLITGAVQVLDLTPIIFIQQNHCKRR